MGRYADVVKNKDAIIQIAELRGAKHIRIFGSVIRGQDCSDSDLDLLVDFEPGRSLVDYVGLSLDLQDYLGYKVDIVTEKGLNCYIRDKIIQEAIPL
jgi:uncharacterized protein